VKDQKQRTTAIETLPREEAELAGQQAEAAQGGMSQTGGSSTPATMTTQTSFGFGAGSTLMTATAN
jgi:hypothetical protein